MGMKDKPNKVTATLKVVIAGEFYDDDATEETLRYAVEQDLEDVGFDVDVALLKEQEAVGPFHKCIGNEFSLVEDSHFDYCPYCGKPVTWAKQEGR